MNFFRLKKIHFFQNINIFSNIHFVELSKAINEWNYLFYENLRCLRFVLHNNGMCSNFIKTWGIYTVDNAQRYLLEIRFVSLIIIFI